MDHRKTFRLLRRTAIWSGIFAFMLFAASVITWTGRVALLGGVVFAFGCFAWGFAVYEHDQIRDVPKAAEPEFEEHDPPNGY